jgi:hypothetical protein
MEKEFIPYEQALALKELGFDEPCLAFYWITGKFYITAEYHNYVGFHKQNQLGDYNYDSISAPTFSQAFRWFKEKHNLFHEIQIDRTAEPKFCFDIFQYEHFGNYEEIRIGEWYLYRTQEEAELECLKELIEIVKRK